MHVYFMFCIDICNMKVSVHTQQFIQPYELVGSACSLQALGRPAAQCSTCARRTRAARVIQFCCCGDFRDLIAIDVYIRSLCSAGVGYGCTLTLYCRADLS